LALAAGFVDAASFLGLGRVFTANMTGNTVLLTIALARGSGDAAARSLAALGGFCGGAALGVAMTATKGPWPAIAARPLVLEGAALIALLAVWAAIGVDAVGDLLIVTAGIAMGAQSAAVRASDVRGVNTTYMTGTLVNAIAGLLDRVRSRSETTERSTLSGAAWVTYGVGALGGAFAEPAWHAAAIAVPLAIVCVVGGMALRQSHRGVLNR
jgi:uncharacterized membrane protein YoaK (UPF0700 family)